MSTIEIFSSVPPKLFSFRLVEKPWAPRHCHPRLRLAVKPGLHESLRPNRVSTGSSPLAGEALGQRRAH